MVIDIKKYTPQQQSLLKSGFFGFEVPANASGKTSADAQIILPMPEGLADTNSVNWTSDTLNSVDATIFSTISSSIDKASLAAARDQLRAAGKKDEDITQLDVLGRAAKNGAGPLTDGLIDGANALTSDPVKKAIKAKLVANAANVLGANVDAARLISRSTGQVLNPNMELLFEGVNLRTFNFSFSFTPRDRSESSQVRNIIRLLKTRMAAKKTANNAGAGSGIFISSPDVFDLRFMSGGRPHPFLYAMKTMALKSMRVNYADGTPYMTYEDATPVKMRMDLQFQELVPVYSEDYNQKDAGPGVGY